MTDESNSQPAPQVDKRKAGPTERAIQGVGSMLSRGIEQIQGQQLSDQRQRRSDHDSILRSVADAKAGLARDFLTLQGNVTCEFESMYKRQKHLGLAALMIVLIQLALLVLVTAYLAGFRVQL